MKLKAVAVAVIALSLTAGGLTGAQAQDRRDDRGRNSADRRDNDRRHDDRGRMNARQDDSNQWRKGGRLPAEYRHRQYVVENWRAHRLSAPPRGYHWVQHGNDYVLASIATGIIAQLLANQQ